MRKISLFIAVLLLASTSHAGIVRFATKRVIVPATKVTYRCGKASLKGLVLVGKTTAKVVY